MLHCQALDLYIPLSPSILSLLQHLLTLSSLQFLFQISAHLLLITLLQSPSDHTPYTPTNTKIRYTQQAGMRLML